jgi:hypothetical protein
MSSASEFGKDLGLIHEAVVTGRKAGATPEDWAKLAHDEKVWPAVLGALRGTTITSVGYFRSLGLTAVIPATTGKRTIAQAKGLFTGYLDPDFKNWGLDVAGEAKPETKVESLELAKDGTFKDFFTSHLDKWVMTDEQIIWVVENRPDLLIQNGSANFFLMKKRNEFFVAYVYWDEGGLGAYVRRLSNDGVWNAGYRHRIVVPQL